MGGLNSKQIADIKKGKTDVLTITGQRKDHLGKKLYGLTSTRTWNLSNNFLSSLSPRISALTLTSLNLASNEFSVFPRELCGLSMLTSLDLSFNFLESIPGDIQRLSSLTELDLSYNHLIFLPAEVGKLPLQQLRVSNNRLERLPEALLRARGLRQLALSHNSLTSFPKGAWTALEELFLACNHIPQVSFSFIHFSSQTPLHSYPTFFIAPLSSQFTLMCTQINYYVFC